LSVITVLQSDERIGAANTNPNVLIQPGVFGSSFPRRSSVCR